MIEVEFHRRRRRKGVVAPTRINQSRRQHDAKRGNRDHDDAPPSEPRQLARGVLGTALPVRRPVAGAGVLGADVAVGQDWAPL